uniref:Gustatory receptor n=1 Tax=Timema bartmani TaxID=61472 RepID=A0A7R9I0B6_9NEOP|nr:unnamed protein product [Timema bartmani]
MAPPKFNLMLVREFRFKILSPAMLYSLFFYIALSAFSAYVIILLAVSIMEKGKLDFTETVTYYREFRFKILSPAMLYSLFFYIALSVFSAYAIILLAVPIMEKRKLDFTESVSYYCNILFTLPHFPVAPLNWMKGAKLVDYINNWQKFQNLFEQVTGKFLRLRLRRRAWVAAIFIPLSGLVIMFTVLVLKSSLELTWMTLAMEVQGSYALSLVIVHGVMWILLCLALQSSGVQLRSIFKQEVSRADCSPSNIAKYRGLWLSLSHLTRELGDIYCYSLGLICLTWFAIFLCSIYLGNGFQELVVSSMSGSNQHVKKENGMRNCAFGIRFLVETTCGSSISIGTVINKMHVRQFRLTIFLEVMIANPPVISFGGYIVIDRQLLVNIHLECAMYLSCWQHGAITEGL